MMYTVTKNIDNMTGEPNRYLFWTVNMEKYTLLYNCNSMYELVDDIKRFNVKNSPVTYPIKEYNVRFQKGEIMRFDISMNTPDNIIGTILAQYPEEFI